MTRRACRQFTLGGIAFCATLAATFLPIARAVEVPEVSSDDPAPHAPQNDLREGGVLAESYQYHRQGGAASFAPHSTIAPPNGWYGYGFPVQTYRWGWFGAGRYYPHVHWHRNYYGDCCRHAYRHGY
jgi:hypothetical protein